MIGTLLAGLLAWGGIGYLVDRLLGFRALFVAIGLVIGAVVSSWLVYIRYVKTRG